MARWRAEAIARFPEMRQAIQGAHEIMAFWIELTLRFEKAYRTDPPDDDLVRRIYQFAAWCLQAPRAEDPGRDPPTAALLCFYEDLVANRYALEDLPRWLNDLDVTNLGNVVADNMDAEAYDRLLARLKRVNPTRDPRPGSFDDR